MSDLDKAWEEEERLERKERRQWLRLLVPLRDLMRATRHVMLEHRAAGNDRPCNCQLCLELEPMAYFANHFHCMIEGQCDPTVFVAMDELPRAGFKALAVRMEERAAECTARLKAKAKKAV